MERQEKSGKKFCLRIQDKETETHIKQKPIIGFLQNLLQQKVALSDKAQQLRNQ